MAEAAGAQQSTQGVVEALSVAISRPVLLDDPSLAPLAYSRQWGEIDGVRSKSILTRGAPPTVRDALMAQGIAEAADVVRTTADPVLGMAERVCVAVRSNKQLLGYIWILDPGATLSDEELDVARTAARRVARLMTESVTRLVGDESALMLKLASEAVEDREAAVADVRAQGALPDGPVVLCLLGAVSDDVELTVVAHMAIRRLSVGHAITGRLADGTAVLASLGDPVLRTLHSGEVAQWLHRIAPEGVAVGQSGSAPLDGLHEAARHARVAFTVARSKPAARSFAAWPTLRADRLVAQLPRSWRDDLPQDLARLIREHPPLAATLAAFLDAGGDVKAAADATSLHRSGVYYRLRRIEELTGLQLDRGDDRLLAHLAVRAERLF